MDFCFHLYWGTCKMFYKVALPFYFLTSNQSSQYFSNIVSILLVVKLYLIVILLWISLMIMSIFHSLLVICISIFFLREMSFFFHWVTVINFFVSITLVASLNFICCQFVYIHLEVFSNFPCDFFLGSLVIYECVALFIHMYKMYNVIDSQFHSIVLGKHTFYDFSHLKLIENCFVV